MKIAVRIFIALVLFFGLERLIRSQTRGFRIDKTIAETPYHPAYEIGDLPLPKELDQPFYFLGSGAQTYSFIGQDQTTVLKLFKHYHCWPSSRVLKKIPGSSKVVARREARMKSIFDSVLLAYKELPEQTQIFHISLIPKLSYPSIVIYDKIGIRHIVNLSHTPFVLQKKVQLLYPYLKQHPGEAKAIISSFFDCLRHRNSLGIANSDNHVGRNFGVWENKVVQFDIGSYFLGEPSDENSAEFEQWIVKNRPDLEDYFHENRL